MMGVEHMDTYLCNSVDFTARAWEDFYDTIGSVDFTGKEDHAIYEVLQNSAGRVDFSDYLKRYIYKKSYPGEKYEEIPFEEYCKTLISLFKDNHTPSGFEEGSTKLSAAVKNWLTRPAVSRKTVLL